MDDKSNENEIVEQESKVFSDFDLLSDNSPHEFPIEYDSEAKILNSQILNPRSCNIAVTGKLGAGKSSAISTYLSIYRNKKNRKDRKYKMPLGSSNLNHYARVSLASFNDKLVDEVSIERSILQQLLYSNTKSSLPNSKIVRTNKTSVPRSLLLTLSIMLFLVSSVMAGTTTASVWFENITWLKYLFFGVAVLALSCIVFVLLHYRKLKRVSYKDLELELKSSDNVDHQSQSLINKFLDEVLYFFECEKIDLVIFEDLDRLKNSNAIFVKLRELNTLINGSKKRVAKVTFLYAVKNDLLNNEEERSKFFDFILTIIPTVNPINTESKIKDKINQLSKKYPSLNLGEGFIKGISVFIPDMRVLNNTFNDYLIMYHKIFLDKNKASYLKEMNLFGLCLYKNLFPQDYALLENNKGLIPLVIDIVGLHNECIRDIDDEISTLEKKIIDLQQESFGSFKELKQLFIGKIYEMARSSYARGGTSVERISTFKGLSLSSLMHPRYESNQYGIDAKYQDDVVDEFYERELLIQEKSQDGIDKAQRKIKELKTQRYLIYSLSFKDIVKKYGLDFCFKAYSSAKEQETNPYYGSISDTQLRYLRFLISRDYIDEHFIEYTSNYEAKLLSPNDMKVLQSIRGREFNFEASVENIASVIALSDEEDFLCGEILMRALLNNIDILYNNSLKNADIKWSNLISLLKEVDGKYRYAINDYFITENLDNCDKVLSFILPECLNLCMWIFENSVDNEVKDKIICGFIKYLDVNLIDKNKINDYLSNHNNYMRLFGLVENDKKVCDFMNFFKPVFKNMSKKALESLVQKTIAVNNYFELSESNISIVMQICGYDTSQLNTCNYTAIINSNFESLINYVNDNIDYYVKAVLLNDQIGCENESIECFEVLLKNEKIKIDSRKALVKKCNCIFANANDFNPELLPVLFEKMAIASTWCNVLLAYEKYGIGCVSNFVILEPAIEGDFLNCDGIQKNTPIKFINDVLKTLFGNELENVIAKINVCVKIKQLNIYEIDDDNLVVLIKKGLLEYDNTAFENLYILPKALCEYLKLNSQQIITDFDVFFDPISRTTDTDDKNKMISTVVACRDIEVSIKKQIIDNFCNEISIVGVERIYIEYMLTENQSIPLNILWQFSAMEIEMTSEERMQIFMLCASEIEYSQCSKEIQEYLNYIDSRWENYFNGEEIYFDKTGLIERFIITLNQLKVVKFNKYRKSIHVYM